MTLVRLKSITYLAIPLMLAFASSDAAIAQAGQRVYVDGVDMPVELPVAFPPVKKIVPKPPKPTEQELRTRAETSDVDAMLAYGDFLSTPSDFPWYLKAAEGGSPKAMMIVANRAKEGKTGSGIDLALSEKWLNKALQAGGQALDRKDIRVLKLLLDGDQYGADGANGLLGAPTKTQYALAIGRAGGFEIEDIFGSVIHIFPNTSEKVQLLEKCSNDGRPWCTEQLAYGYLNGDNGLIIDHGLGIKLLTRVAQAGYQTDYFGNLQSLSQTEKIQFWKTAIEHGALGYTEFLADAYRDGNGVPKSASIAAALLQTLIRRPDVTDKNMPLILLARMYVDGTSFPPNDQLFMHVLNLTSSLSAEDQEWIVGCFVNCAPGRINEASLNLSPSTRLSLLKSVVEKSPPFNNQGSVNGTFYQYTAALRLGDLYSSGQQDVKQSYADAMIWYKKAEQIGTGPVDGHDFIYDGVAAIKIGQLYERGLGVPADSSAAGSWYQKAADNLMNQMTHSNGQFDSLYMSSLMQLFNSVKLPKESVDHVISFIRSSAEAGDIYAQKYLAEMYYEGKYMPQSYSDAAGWFEKCGAHNNTDAPGWKGDCLKTVGNMYLQGQGVMRDPAKAAYYYQQDFDIGLTHWQGDSSVRDILLPMYCGGEGIPMDRPKALAIYKKDADQNDPFAELGVGAMYQMGWGVQQDLAEAFNWYRKVAADKNYGSAQAKADLTRIFRDCRGTPDNFNAAVSLYEKASGGQH